VTDRKFGTLEIAAAIVLLLSAMVDRKISIAFVAAALIGRGLYHLLKKS